MSDELQRVQSAAADLALASGELAELDDCLPASSYMIGAIYRRMRLAAPSVEDIKRALRKISAEDSSPHAALTPRGVMRLLTECEYPGVVAACVIPPERTASDCVPAVIDDGCVVVMEANTISGPRTLIVDGHTPESALAYGFEVGRILMPWSTLPLQWSGQFLPVVLHQNELVEFGFDRLFITVFPPLTRRHRAKRVDEVVRLSPHSVLEQPESTGTCGQFASLNAFMKMNLPVPGPEQVKEAIKQVALCHRVGESGEALTLPGIFELMLYLNYPGLIGYAHMPSGFSAAACVPFLVDMGLGVMVGLHYVVDDTLWGHALVVDECFHDGARVMCSALGKEHVPWTTLPKDWDCKTVETTLFRGARMQCGLAPLAVVLWPTNAAWRCLVTL